MFLEVSVCPQGGAWSRGMPGPGGCLVPGGVPGLVGGYLAPGGAWSRGAGIPACTEAEPPPGEMTTAADGMHPTGMHSCHNIAMKAI